MDIPINAFPLLVDYNSQPCAFADPKPLQLVHSLINYVLVRVVAVVHYRVGFSRVHVGLVCHLRSRNHPDSEVGMLPYVSVYELIMETAELGNGEDAGNHLPCSTFGTIVFSKDSVGKGKAVLIDAVGRWLEDKKLSILGLAINLSYITH